MWARTPRPPAIRRAKARARTRRPGYVNRDVSKLRLYIKKTPSTWAAFFIAMDLRPSGHGLRMSARRLQRSAIHHHRRLIRDTKVLRREMTEQSIHG
jgi:hypothetical protein